MNPIDPKQLKRDATWRAQDILFGLERVPESQKLILGSSDFGVYEFDVAAEKPERVAFTGEGHTSYVTGAAIVGQTLVTCSYDGKLIWWNLADRQLIRKVDAHEKWIRRVIPWADKNRVISVADDMQCKVWNVETGELVASFTDHPAMTPNNYPSMLFAVDVSADSRWIATGDKVGRTVIWNAETFEKTGEVETPILYTWDPKIRRHSIGGIRSVRFSHDGNRLAVGGIGKIGNIDHLDAPSRLEVFEWQAGKRLHELEDPKHKGLIEQIRWAEDDAWIMVAGGDHKGFVLFYDAASGEPLHAETSPGHVHGTTFSDDGQTIYVAGHQMIERFAVPQEAVPAESNPPKAAPAKS